MPSEATAEENKFTSDTENGMYQGEIWPLQQMEGRLVEVTPIIATKKGEEPEESFSVLSSPMPSGWGSRPPKAQKGAWRQTTQYLVLQPTTMRGLMVSFLGIKMWLTHNSFF